MIGWNGNVHPAAQIFPMTEDEVTEMEADIRENGLLQPGWLLPDGTLLDGRLRRLACEKAGVAMRWEIYEGHDPVGLVVSANLQRRHLTTGQKAAIAADLESAYSTEAVKRRSQAAGKPRGQKQASVVAAGPPQKSRDRAAQMAGTSGRSVSRYKRLRNEAPDLAEKVKAGILALDQASKQLTRRHSDAEELSARRICLSKSPLPDAEGEGWEMRYGTFEDRLAELPDGALDALVTDPPYPAEFLEVWPKLSEVAARVLKPQGLLIALSGKIFLDKVMAGLGTHLNYGWLYEMPLPGPQARIMGRHIFQQSKPWLVYTNGTWPSGRIEWHPDSTTPSRPSGKDYRWQQDVEPAAYLIEKLTNPGALICDPFCGTGSFGAAAVSSGRTFIGIEADVDRYSHSVARLGAINAELEPAIDAA